MIPAEPGAGAQSETARITRILVKRPDDAFISQDHLEAQWRILNYASCPDYRRAVEEYERFLDLLKGTGADILFLPRDDNLSIDSIYVRDSLVVTARGVILCKMGKEARRGEPEAAASFLKRLGIPVLGGITGDGCLEGGDLIWLDERALVVGEGYRTNADGIRQLKELTAGLVDRFIVVPLPHWNGPADVMHLMSNISPIDRDLAVVYSRLLTVPFRQYLLDRGIRLVEVPDEEYQSKGCNVLAVAPRKCVVLDGNPLTRKRLESEGVETLVYRGEEISRKGAGGPTCLTRPLVRETAKAKTP